MFLKSEIKTKTSSKLDISVKLALLLVTATALSFGVASFAMMFISFDNLNNKQVIETIEKSERNKVSGHINDILSGQSLSNITITFTNENNPSEIFNTVVDASGNYELSLGGVGYYAVVADYGGIDYYDYQDRYLQINSFPFVHDMDFFPYTPYDLEVDWDCGSEFNIVEGNFPLITYIDRYLELIDIYLNTGNLTIAEWNELKDLKLGSSNSIKSELIVINSDLSNPVYTDDNYASILFDKALCNYRKEGLFDKKISWTNEPLVVLGDELIVSTLRNTPDRIGLLATVKNLVDVQPTQVGEELMSDQIVEKILSMLRYQSEYIYEMDIISARRPYFFWGDEYQFHLNVDGQWAGQGALFPNTESILHIFYARPIGDLIGLADSLLDSQDLGTMADLYIQSNLFGEIYKLMTLPSITDSAIPNYRPYVIIPTLDILNDLYPYVFRNQGVQDIVKWNNENKDPNSFFWTYFASNKDFYISDQEMIDISNLFGTFCTNTTTAVLDGMCSPLEKPLYCDNGSIINNCQRCGCVSGAECNDRGFCEISELPNMQIYY